LREGAGSALYGLEVCRGLDMDSGFLAKAYALRKTLEGSMKESRYNADVLVTECTVCGSKKDLESHHIIPQKDGINNRKSNLVALCSTCHDRHHAGTLTIKGWIDTSHGRKLEVDLTAS